ncbi:hypothetical protein [Actinomadura bangladeshensis]|uniref:Uncharacterized protein n=1 Tax=Actinomadura bangladeshensis TaxID=453573 RepID=A0A6L9QDH3_9ACTN|nr:hypothetical protein [Actinomadura bangladeshensis]NEA23499.1 hypothetical protein [Actinomadura bangladeshensis]
MSFPWTNLITAGSTLVAALGGASLTAFLSGRADVRRLDHERWMNRRSERTGAYADFLGLAHADVRILRIALFRFAHGVPGDEEARRMIEEASEIVVAFNEARARVEIVGSEEAAEKAWQVSEAAAQVGLRLSDSYLSGRPVESEAGTAEHRDLRRAVEQFAALCRRELTE